jgi:hypothetical protein
MIRASASPAQALWNGAYRRAGRGVLARRFQPLSAPGNGVGFGAFGDGCAQSVSTRKIKAISEELCGHELSASPISELNKTMDAELEKFARQRIEGEDP